MPSSAQGVTRPSDLVGHSSVRHAAPGERVRLGDPAERLAASSSFLDATAYGVRGMVVDADEGHHFFRQRLGDIVAVLVGRTRQAGIADRQTAEEVGI